MSIFWMHSCAIVGAISIYYITGYKRSTTVQQLLYIYSMFLYATLYNPYYA